MNEGPRVVHSKVSTEVLAANERRAAYARARRIQKQEENRRRQEHLAEQTPAIDRALQAYAELIGDGDVLEVRLRSPFIRLLDERPARPAGLTLREDVQSRPPLTALIASPGSRALPVYLTMIYDAHLRNRRPGAHFVNDRHNVYRVGDLASWSEMCGFHKGATAGGKRKQRISVSKALTQLAEHRLVGLGGVPGRAGRFAGFDILAETGDETQYAVPGEGVRNRDVLRIPEAFFRNGWHLTLTPPEVALLFAIMDRSKELAQAKRQEGTAWIGVDLKPAIRWGRYGLSDEAYETAEQLRRFGLIEVIDPNQTRFKAGEEDQRLPHRLIYPPRTNTEPFSRVAPSAVRSALQWVSIEP